MSFYCMFFFVHFQISETIQTVGYIFGSQSIIPIPAALRDLLEMQIWGPHPWPTDSKATGVAPGVCASQDFQVMGLQVTV